ncbi:hypothetical protein IDH18_01025 [Pelagibacterales bacterium SAG-MED41]|nr:hypothetical protein [Pelagibacterales bacterium SAG-MED41]|tara:strand:+ start:301 stop:765 length:465 start_codon:yes stop_codon:yes gene_type:complete
MKKIFLVILSLILVSCTGNYKVKNYKNEIPKWYVKDSESKFKFFGKSQSDSENLEIAMRKAEVLAVGDALFKIKSNINAVKESYLADKQNKKNSSSTSEISVNYEEKIIQAIKDYDITEYKTSKKKIYKTKKGYKVFLLIEFNKKDLFNSLDRV